MKYKICLIILAAWALLLPTAVLAATTYKNPDLGISLNYSGLMVQDKAVASYIPASNYFIDSSGENLLTLYVRPSAYKGTNLESGWLNLSVKANLNQADCYQYLNVSGMTIYASYPLDQIRKVQGNRWHFNSEHPYGGAAAGHSSSAEMYRLYKNDVCYEMVLGLSEYNRSNLENPNSVKQVSSKKIYNYLGAAFNRLKVK